LVKVKQNPKIQILENHRAIDLLMVGEGSETEKRDHIVPAPMY